MIGPLESASLGIRGEATFNINARLDLLRRRLSLGEFPAEDFETEARMQSLVSGMRLYGGDEKKQSEKDGAEGRSSNVFTRLFNPRSDHSTFVLERKRLVEEAFFWERNRVYARAIELYGKALVLANPADPISDILRLHVAFCYLMIADYNGAEERCLELAGTSFNTEVRDSAQLILNFIGEVRTTDFTLTDSEKRSLELGKNLFFDVNYSEAVTELDSFLDGEESYTGQSEARYYKGRCYEELGRISEAVEEYRRIILLSENSQWYREAGNRLLILEAFYGVEIDDDDALAAMGMASADAGINELISTLSPLLTESRDKNAESPQISIFSETSEQEEENGEILVKSSPPGARISVEGNDVGISPLFVSDLACKETSVTAEYDGEVRSLSILVKAGDIVPVEFDFKPSTGILVVGSYWTDSEFYLDDERIYPIDGVLRNQTPGRHKLRVTGKSLAGTDVAWEGMVTVIAGDVVSLAVP